MYIDTDTWLFQVLTLIISYLTLTLKFALATGHPESAVTTRQGILCNLESRKNTCQRLFFAVTSHHFCGVTSTSGNFSIHFWRQCVLSLFRLPIQKVPAALCFGFQVTLPTYFKAKVVILSDPPGPVDSHDNRGQ